ncbi:hypothetical protein KQQSB11_120004 [Klebsiella quasipneumoniae subsp. quasipneumoniae]|nr:hypothetical protein KQQSB11_120004 [Klebsiella quasipneumoniae subsp. quasipneumoniae]
MQHHRRRGIHPQQAPRRRARFQQVVFCRRHLLQYHLHPAKIALAFLCQTELTGGPIEQANTKLGLELFDCPADGRVGLTKLFGRPAETPAFHYRHKDGDLLGCGSHYCTCSKILLIL